jgi:hypothetical protein
MSQRKPRHIPERFLRQLWKHQQFRTTELATTDGRPIRVLSPGRLNRDGGPDFIDAAIRIGGIVYRGDVELHQRAEEWANHLHQHDRKYNAVILHVVLNSPKSAGLPTTASRRPLPVLELSRFLNPSFHETWRSMIRNEREERTTTIKCRSVNDAVDAAIIRRWLGKLAVERIELKIRRFEERLKELAEDRKLLVQEPPPKYDEIPFGLNPDELPPPVRNYSPHDFAKGWLWEELIYEGAMESLGYSKNQQPFLRIARSLTLSYLKEILEHRTSKTELSLSLEALLFHVSGLLPFQKDASDSESRARLRLLRHEWKQLKTLYRREFLAHADWQFFRLRPENFPTVRLAGAAQLIAKFQEENVFKSIVTIVKNTELTMKRKFRALEELFIVPAGPFWSHHVRFEEPSTSDAKTLIGKHRADDIILNTVVPVSLLYARIFKDKEVRQGTLRLFDECPGLAENAITRTIGSQLIKRKFDLGSAMLQQGAIQLFKSYCTPERCMECAVGRIVFRPLPA